MCFNYSIGKIKSKTKPHLYKKSIIFIPMAFDFITNPTTKGLKKREKNPSKLRKQHHMTSPMYVILEYDIMF